MPATYWNPSENAQLAIGPGLKNAQTIYNGNASLTAEMGGGPGAQSAMGVVGNVNPGMTAPVTSWQAAKNIGQGFSSGGVGGGLQSFFGNLGGLFISDARMKDNIRPVGMLNNGLPVYAFNFKGGGPTQIGLLAQEVAQVMPQAVQQASRGMLAVDYDMATQQPQQGQQQAPQQGAPRNGMA